MTSAKPEFGYLFLADISGFSSYLAGVELEHAGGILQKLLECVARKIEPPFRVQAFDMDSVFAYASQAKIGSFENLHELIKVTYLEFRSNLNAISKHATCIRAACRNVTSLDLKFMVHYGEYILSSVADKPVLYGLDPTFVRHRGWKDAVSASVGWRGYVLFTGQCMASLSMDDGKFQGERFAHDQFKMIGLQLKNGE